MFDDQLNAPPIVEMHEGIYVVRDDLLEGGSKTRFIQSLVRDFPGNEMVYGSSPATGYAQIALARVCSHFNKKCTLFMAKRKLEKNPQRYIKIPMGWEVSAAPDDKQAVPPYMISDGISFGQKPTATKLLDDTGALVVELGDEYLVSKRINLDLRDSNETNPHFSYKIRGEVRLPLIDDMGKTIGTKTTPIGKTIPIIRVDIDALNKKVEEESIPLAKAGVADVVFISEDANKLLAQINFTYPLQRLEK